MDEEFGTGYEEIEGDSVYTAWYEFDVGDDDQPDDGGSGEQPTDGDAEMVTATFALTLYGDVTFGDSFYVQYLVEGQARELTTSVPFCGELVESEPKPACEGNGKIYTIEVEFDKDTTIEFNFGRHNFDYSDIEVFYEITEKLDSDFNNSAYYTYDDGQTDDVIALEFVVDTNGDCYEDATFFALVGTPDSDLAPTPMTDGDGDGTYTAIVLFDADMARDTGLVVEVVQGVGVVETEIGTFPGEPVQERETHGSADDPLHMTEDATIDVRLARGAEHRPGRNTVLHPAVRPGGFGPATHNRERLYLQRREVGFRGHQG